MERKVMKYMSVTNIAKACGGTYVGADKIKATEVSSVVIDSRLVEQGSLFIATRGARVDGHDFIDNVFEKGAICTIVEKAPNNEERAYILVKDSFQALKDIAKYYRSVLDITVVGITGSVGKTSTKEMIAAVLEQKYKVLKTVGNLNNEVGLPLTILKIREEHEVAVVEMGISDFGEMHRLSEIAKPDICVITNIGNCHLENLKSQEGILKAKSEIFDFMNEQGYICLNGDDKNLSKLDSINNIKPLFFGVGEHNDIFATDIVNNGFAGSACKIHTATDLFDIKIPIPGSHMVDNALAAIAVGTIMNLTIQMIQEGLSTVEALSGRSHLIKTDRYMIIDDCYNANPMSMKAAIDLLGEAPTRKVAILGDMFELGENADALHSEIGDYISKSKTDIVIFIGEKAQFMNEAAVKANTEKGSKGSIIYYQTRDEAIQKISATLQQGDTILVKASHGMGFDVIVKHISNDVLCIGT